MREEITKGEAVDADAYPVAKPSHPAVRDIETVLQNIAMLQEKIDDWQGQIAELSREIKDRRQQMAFLEADLSQRVWALSEIEDTPQRLAIVRFLYWKVSRVDVVTLARALFGPRCASSRFQKVMRELVGPLGWARCDGCHSATVPIEGRAQMVGHAPKLCQECQDVRGELRTQRNEQARAAIAAVAASNLDRERKLKAAIADLGITSEQAGKLISAALGVM